MKINVDTNCPALNWIINNARYLGYESFDKEFFARLGRELSFDGSHVWNFEGYLSEKMVKEIRGFAVREGRNEVGILHISGYEFQMVLPYGHKVNQTQIRICLEA